MLVQDKRYEIIPTIQLKPFIIRDIRDEIIQKLKERISSKGYNPARPLSVVEDEDGYIVADGNHRLVVLKELGIEAVPCIVYKNANPYSIAVTSNQDEDTYAPMDLFDWLNIIQHLRSEGLTQQQIAERIGWSRVRVKDYVALLDKVGAEVLNLVKQHQEGRAPTNGANAPTFNFTEGWFRTSGLYDLEEQYQIKLIERFIADKCNWNKDKVQREAAKYKMWQEFKRIAKTELVNEEDYTKVVELIENDTFKSEAQLRQKIADFNKKAKNKLICGDAVIELEKLEDGSVDLVITDPPYGIDYTSNRSQFSEHITKQGIHNDRLDEALSLFNTVCEILNRKTKPNAHFYIFTSWKVYPQFKQIIEKYFTIKNLIIWDKGNHGAGDLEGAWGNQYEMIIFAVKGDKPLNYRRGDIISIPRIPSEKLIHPTQKPVELIKELLKVSAQLADTVCDPFMGSGATIKAVKEFGQLNYIGIEIDASIFEKAKAFIGGE